MLSVIPHWESTRIEALDFTKPIEIVKLALLFILTLYLITFPTFTEVI